MLAAKRKITIGIQHVVAEIPALRETISLSAKFDLLPKTPTAAEAFESLTFSIISQQISTSAAATISARVKKELHGSITPLKASRLPSERFRELGVSGSKTRTIHELSAAVLAKDIHLATLSEMTDAEIVTELSSVWGIGKWTAQMFLMFDLGRLDVWPAGDFGVRKGWQIAHQNPEMLAEKEFDKVAQESAPYRSIAAWYCWRAIDLQKAGKL